MDVVSIVVYGCGCLWSIPIWSDDPQSTFIYLHILLIIHVSSFFTQNLCQGSMPPSVVYTWFTTNNGPKSWVDPGLTIPAAQYCPSRRGPGGMTVTVKNCDRDAPGNTVAKAIDVKGRCYQKRTRKNHIAWSNHIIKYHGFILLLFVLKKLTCLFFWPSTTWWVNMRRMLYSSIKLYGDGSKPWYLVNPKIAGKWMFIPLKCIYRYWPIPIFYPWLYPSYSIFIHLSFHMFRGIEAKPTELPGVKTGFHFHSVPWQWMLVRVLQRSRSINP